MTFKGRSGQTNRLNNVLAMLAAAMVLGPGFANGDDSLVSLGAGGLQLLTSDDIVLEQQDLSISPGLVQVRFRFLNQGPAAVESLVAFVQPDLTPEDYARRFEGLPGPEGDDIVSFRASSGGRPIQVIQDMRGVIGDGTDITDRLARAGADANFFRIAPGTTERLKAAGLMDENGIPAWTMRMRLYWRQVFPVGEPVIIEHSYVPLTGAVSLLRPLITGFGEHPGLAREYCMTERDVSGALRLVDAAANRGQDVLARFVDYRLTTGANWKGPIGRLTITIDTGSPGRMLATCFPGLRASGPGTYSVTIKDIEPDEDIALMIIEP